MLRRQVAGPTEKTPHCNSSGGVPPRVSETRGQSSICTLHSLRGPTASGAWSVFIRYLVTVSLVALRL